ncbi:hypothetical protein FHL15_001010 [Xylaria flabelliformis]|uniref:Uncharacterized protein n=1 Tax=Xylaria flabelliformis TaxID=2512241 RepID=A0A553IDT3_9PEZI|nr:hypothetical protein FHL15_001010 [Xylaria flabelliformis]
MPSKLLLRAFPRDLPCNPRRPNIYRIVRRQQSSSAPSQSPKDLPKSAAQAEAEACTGPRIGEFAAEQARSAAINTIPAPNIIAPLPFWQRLGPLTRAGQAYARAQRSRPWVTQVASALVVYLCADFGAQRMNSGGHQSTPDDDKLAGEGKSAAEDDSAEEKGRKHDWARTARALFIGGSAAIPGYVWFSFLSRSFNYSSTFVSIGVKVVVNQLTFTPLFNCYFFGAQALLSGDTAAEAWRRVYNTVPVSWINSCKIWPAVTAFSFAFIPFEYRNIFGGVVAVGWQTYLSFLNGRAERLEALRQKEHVVSDATKPLKSLPVKEKSSVVTIMQVQELAAGKQVAALS